MKACCLSPCICLGVISFMPVAASYASESDSGATWHWTLMAGLGYDKLDSGRSSWQQQFAAIRAENDRGGAYSVQAAKALGRVGNEEHLGLLESLLTDQEWWVRYRAAQAIVMLPFLGPNQLRRIRERQSDRYAVDQYEADSAFSTLDIPVSLIVPAYNESVSIITSIKALLQLEYSQFELVVVNDGSSDDTLEKMIEEFDMRKAEFGTPTRISRNFRVMSLGR